jgi:hypothetical protein
MQEKLVDRLKVQSASGFLLDPETFLETASVEGLGAPAGAGALPLVVSNVHTDLDNRESNVTPRCDKAC